MINPNEDIPLNILESPKKKVVLENKEPKKPSHQEIFISGKNIKMRTVKELQALAKKHGLRGYSVMRKAQLEKALGLKGPGHSTHKGGARIGAPAGARLAYDALPHKRRRRVHHRRR